MAASTFNGSLRFWHLGLPVDGGTVAGNPDAGGLVYWDQGLSFFQNATAEVASGKARKFRRIRRAPQPQFEWPAVELPCLPEPVLGIGEVTLPEVVAEATGRVKNIEPRVGAANVAGTITIASEARGGLRFRAAGEALLEVTVEARGGVKFRAAGQALLEVVAVTAAGRHDRSLRDRLEREDEEILAMIA